MRKVILLGAMLGAGLSSSALAAGAAKDNFPVFTPKISTDLHQNFLDFDRDRDGYISFAEFSYAYHHYYVTGDDPAPLSQHFAAMDADGNGLVSEKEFIAGHSAPLVENYWMRWVPNGHKEDAHN